MADATVKSQGTQPPPDRGHPMPRRASPEQSITLRHHRLARDASMKPPPGPLSELELAKTKRRDSSGDSRETGHSEPKRWFDRSNRNADAMFDSNSMDVDPPFFQKETDSLNEEPRDVGSNVISARYPDYTYLQPPQQVPGRRPAVTHSSAADDYRSVIDDLTIENKRLKEELKRYRQFNPDLLRKEKLFEIKVHGLPKRKKRELEATLRNFAASLEGSTEASSDQLKKSRHAKNVHSSLESTSKHPSSSSSHSRPVDSAYASISVGPSSAAAHSSGTSLHQPPTLPGAKSTEGKVESYLRDIPEGLYPRHTALADRDKKKLVVRRLERLFTGTITGKKQNAATSSGGLTSPRGNTTVMAPPPPTIVEPSREAHIEGPDDSQKKSRSQDNLSTSNSGADQTDSRGNDNGSGQDTGERSGGGSGGSGHDRPPATASPPEQRPTRPLDLDPDRVQSATENMDYIRHLGLVPPELLGDKRSRYHDVSPDADGWVYLNLLSSMAQLHMLNVTPDFIRLAVNEKSTKFQISPDRRKIRWRGGSKGTKFSSDSSGENSQKSPSTDDTDGSNDAGQRKSQKTQRTGTASAPSSKNAAKSIAEAAQSSDSFHYKPLFVHQSSSNETSWEETGSQMSCGAAEDSNLGNTSGWGLSGSGSSNLRKKRRRDGAVIYYSGAPFCTDFSGDPGDVSPTTYMTSTGRDQSGGQADSERPQTSRSPSGSSLPLRPLNNAAAGVLSGSTNSDADGEPPQLDTDNGSSTSEPDLEFPWSIERQDVDVKALEPTMEPCGLGGVLPEDHFAVVVTTRRPILGGAEAQGSPLSTAEPESVIGRLATTTSKGSAPSGRHNRRSVEIEYLTGRIHRLRPVALPPPTMFFPPFSSDSDSEEEDAVLGLGLDDADEAVEMQSSAGDLSSRRVNPHLSDIEYPDDKDLSSNDEEDEVDMQVGFEEASSSAGEAVQKQGRNAVAGAIKRLDSGSAGRSSGGGKGMGQGMQIASSVATAGEAESGYSSSVEDG